MFEVLNRLRCETGWAKIVSPRDTFASGHSAGPGGVVRYFFTAISNYRPASARSGASKTARRLATTWGFRDGLGRSDGAFFIGCTIRTQSTNCGPPW